MPRTHLLVSVLLLLLVGGLLLACGTASGTVTSSTSTVITGTASLPTPPAHYRVGQSVKIGEQWVITVNRLATTQGASSDPPPAVGDTYLLIDLTMKNLANGQQFANPFDYTLRDSQGNNEQTGILLSVPVFGGNLTAGEQAHGQLVYQIPSNVHQFTLSYTPSAIYPLTTLAEWDLTVR